MKHVLLTTCAFFLFLTSTARAEFAGTWSGPGEVIVNDGLSFNCKKIVIKLSQTPTTLVEESGMAKCAFTTTNLVRTPMEIRGGDLYLNNEKIGTISETEVVAKIKQSGTDVAFDVKLETATTASFVADIEKGNDSYHLTGDMTREDSEDLQ